MFVLHAMRHITSGSSSQIGNSHSDVRWPPELVDDDCKQSREICVKLDIDTRILERRTRRTGMIIWMRLDIAKKNLPLAGWDLFSMSKNNSELWNLFPELLNLFFLFILHTLCVKLVAFDKLVVKMWFKLQPNCIPVWVSCPHNSAIFRTPKIDHNWRHAFDAM